MGNLNEQLKGPYMAIEQKLDRPAVNGKDGHLALFTALRQLLRPYEKDLAVKTDKPGNCYLETRSASLNGRRLFFAAVKAKKNYVSFYLTPLYMFPDLSNRISPTLKKKMQGQSCFNFTTLDKDCFAELEDLTQAGFEKIKSESLL
jgi:hypothetical protein